MTQTISRGDAETRRKTDQSLNAAIFASPRENAFQKLWIQLRMGDRSMRVEYPTPKQPPFVT